MKYLKLTRNHEFALSVIKSNPGCTAGGLEWMALGGRFDINGNAVPTNLGVVDPVLFAKAKKLGSRASELAAGQNVFRRQSATYRLLPNDGQRGYWPVAGESSKREEVKQGVAVAQSKPARLVGSDRIAECFGDFDE